MVTTKQAVGAIVRHLGFDPPRAAAVARRLTEAGALPSGAPKTPPQLSVSHVVALVIGCSLDVPLRAVAVGVRAYLELAPGGADLTGAPGCIPRSAGHALELFADIAIHGDSDLLRRDRIEVVSTWPEIAFLSTDSVGRFVEPGANPSTWQHGGHRRSTIITGAALVDALRALFAKESK